MTELEERVASLMSRQQHNEAKIQESDRLFADTDRHFKEARERSEKIDRQIEEAWQYLRETDRQLRELKVQIAGLSDKFGGFTEGLALPSMTRILTRRFHMDVVMPRVLSRLNGRSFEVDVMAYSHSRVNAVYIVEVKSRLRHEAIVQMKRTLRDFPDFFPLHRGKEVYGILAAVDAPATVRRKALAEGLYLARIHDEEFEIDVPAGFRPRDFRPPA
jgi:hypothetical protein